MCKMLKSCFFIAGGIFGIVTGIKLLIWWDRRSDSPPSSPKWDKESLEKDDSELSNNEEDTPKIWSMKKEDLISECNARGLNTTGTVRVLRERIKLDNKKDT